MGLRRREIQSSGFADFKEIINWLVHKEYNVDGLVDCTRLFGFSFLPLVVSLDGWRRTPDGSLTDCKGQDGVGSSELGEQSELHAEEVSISEQKNNTVNAPSKLSAVVSPTVV